MATLGDIDGDGRDDLAVGSAREDGRSVSGPYCGMLRLLSGADGLPIREHPSPVASCSGWGQVVARVDITAGFKRKVGPATQRTPSPSGSDARSEP